MLRCPRRIQAGKRPPKPPTAARPRPRTEWEYPRAPAGRTALKARTMKAVPRKSKPLAWIDTRLSPADHSPPGNFLNAASVMSQPAKQLAPSFDVAEEVRDFYDRYPY